MKIKNSISARIRQQPMECDDRVFCLGSVNRKGMLEIIKRKLTIRRLGITTQREV